MPGLISRFIGEHADILFRTVEAHKDHLIRGLHDGSLDLALTYSLDLTEEIAFTPLLTLPSYVILPKAHRLASACKLSLADLVPEPYVLLDMPHCREYFAALFDALGVRPVPAFRSSQPEVVRGIIANGLGYSIPQIAPHGDREEFVVKRLKDDVNPTVLGIAQSRAMKPRQVVHRFASFCATHIHRLHLAI